MKPSKILVFHIVLFLLGVSALSQTPPDSGSIVQAERTKLIKSDILKDIKLMSGKDQAYYYVRLADTLWNKNQKEEASAVFQKGVQIGIDPATRYENEGEKLSNYWNLLSGVLEKNAVLADKLIFEIRKIKIDESNAEVLERSNKTYIVIGEQILTRRKDIQTGFDFAINSLKGSKPAINQMSARFYSALKSRDEKLADLYFAKMIESVKAAKDVESLSWLIVYFIEKTDLDSSTTDKIAIISDSKKRDFLELLLSFIQTDVDNLTLKKASDCKTIISGQAFLKEYKRLLPEKSQLVEKAIGVCQDAEIKFWNKPDFRRKPRKTAQDYLVTAKEIDDKKVRAHYLKAAAQEARKNKAFQFSIDILDGIEPELRDSFWHYSKIVSVSKLLDELFQKEDFAAITKLLEIQREEFRPFMVIDAFRSKFPARNIKPEQKEFALELITRARAALNKIDVSPVDTMDIFTNPTNFGLLTIFYVELKAYPQAIASHTESIKSLNRYIRKLPQKYKKNRFIPRYSSYTNFINSYPTSEDMEFIDQYFDRIYANIGSIENNQIRLSERIDLLRKNLQERRN